MPASYDCACPHSVLTYTCTTVGQGVTLWEGTAFNCPSTANQIILRNSQFASGGTGTFGACNDGNIVAEGVRADSEDNRHTSQLNVTVSARLDGLSIKCVYNSDEGVNTVGEATLTVILSKRICCIPKYMRPLERLILFYKLLQIVYITLYTGHYPPPIHVYVANASSEKLTFSWTSMAPDCSSVHYRINSSNCGTCPTIVNTMTATCYDLKLSRDAPVCTFTVQNDICGVTGSLSNPLLVAIKGSIIIHI